MSYKVKIFKILPYNRMNEMLDGNLYMNTDQFFTKIEETDTARHDIDEDADELWQIKKITAKNDQGEWITIGGDGQGIYRADEKYKQKLNIFCMYAMKVIDPFFDKRNLNFGDTIVAITDVIKFLDRVKSAAKKEDKELYYGLITYVDKNSYDGKLGPFKKFNNYSYQNEFRFVINGGNGHPIKLNIGNIRDICVTYPAMELEKSYGKTYTTNP